MGTIFGLSVVSLNTNVKGITFIGHCSPLAQNTRTIFGWSLATPSAKVMRVTLGRVHITGAEGHAIGPGAHPYTFSMQILSLFICRINNQKRGNYIWVDNPSH